MYHSSFHQGLENEVSLDEDFFILVRFLRLSLLSHSLGFWVRFSVLWFNLKFPYDQNASQPISSSNGSRCSAIRDWHEFGSEEARVHTVTTTLFCREELHLTDRLQLHNQRIVFIVDFVSLNHTRFVHKPKLIHLVDSPQRSLICTCSIV